MTTIVKTDTAKSPLLQPVIQRDYTKGLNISQPGDTGQKPPEQTAKPDEPKPDANSPKPGANQPHNFDPPPQDNTKEFAFDELNENASDVQEGEDPGVTMPAGSARTFANFVGNAIQIYLPKATYGYVKIDMDNVTMNVQKGYLTLNYVDVFTEINKSAEESLKIPDENIKMWKAAFQHYLEYKQVAFANPETEFWAATALLLGDQAVRTYQLKKHMEKLMKDALEASNPGMFNKTKTTTAAENINDNKPNKDEARAA